MTRPRGTAHTSLRVLDAWRMIEQFSPQSVPSVSPRAVSRDSQVIDWRPGDDLPWEYLAPPQPITRRHGEKISREWKHELFLGVYPLREIYEVLDQLLADSPDGYDPRVPGVSAAAYVVVDASGILRVPSATLSSALWGVGRVNDPGPSDPTFLDGFDDATQAYLDSIDALEARRRDASGAEEQIPLTSDAVQDIVAASVRATAVQSIPPLATSLVRIRSTAIAREGAHDDGSDFLNSFLLEELSRVRSAVAGGDVGPALRLYLSPHAPPRGRRVDIVRDPSAVDGLLEPEQLPVAHWPAEPHKHLARNQQLAVNRAVGGSEPLIAVNGPPGTGKSTLLRDVLAGLVAERARHLSRLTRPEDAFTGGSHSWEVLDGGRTFKRVVHILNPALTGYEMLLASANNAAVENISEEIPAVAALDEPWSAEADYFGDLATLIARSDPIQPADGSDDSRHTAWGLVAARLGRKQNRSTFTDAFWFGDAASSTPGMQRRLQAWADGTSQPPSWAQAREAFTAAEAKVARLVEGRQAIAARRRQLARMPTVMADARAELAAADHARAVVRDQSARVYERLAELEGTLQAAQERVEHHTLIRPGIWKNLWSWGRPMAAWRERHAELLADMEATRSAHAALRRDEEKHRLAIVDIEAQRRRAEIEVSRTAARIKLLEEDLGQDRAALGEAYPNEDPRGRELRAPWLDSALDRARTEVFLAALDLHRALLANAPRHFLSNLRAAREVIRGDAPPDLDPAAVVAAWQSFFMVVPLVSSTFASIPRMLSTLGRESLGWLLIDEAGQAAPQLTVGALWRARRVMVVGDPLQLEPIATIPSKLALDIAATTNIDSLWLAPRGSVQSLADRVSRVGAELGSDGQAVWVGSPLRVHRRCDDPMFSISNEIAYDGMMISAVDRKPTSDAGFPEDPYLASADGRPAIAESYWADRPSTVDGHHVQPPELEAFRKALSYLHGAGVADADIIAISPFRSVADRLAAITRDHPDLKSGTIHVAQGREADVVILVLGGARDRTGAKQWATRGPNLINVAVSRAKRRLYVIGDHRLWSPHPYVSALARELPRRTTPGA